ncbi:hypothetical protein PPYR_04739 [Photinus pyralis]|uniref:Uncharacterized protein n=1 Tax=Photinus pyralis TaxID=7054 RepID=A0A5N4AZ41_PHOPY|nr:hypothetical protein PPYR_04739 [Photinus pyralis]
MLSAKQVQTFLQTAPDNISLTSKVATIMAIMGGCMANELHLMKIQDLQDLSTTFLVDVTETKNKVSRQFSITEVYYNTVKKYISLRPSNVGTNSFFLKKEKPCAANWNK